ncbi:pilus assembly protein [Micromonospora sp. DR5-3]|uniref:TadE/TadG family type IV pilus assembly protein n=1 Tax=unclassified Micromonospora TaxID=2617518 RepID=UPI0011DB6F46|nr:MULTISPECIES: TadE family protein [unclassified Micromonospora]MCW3813591.1 pilus assembly protein [Micromonospora sp. DR5-3]TYC25708.1 pilus assembly protein [Micromonospora sp. MP36]
MRRSVANGSGLAADPARPRRPAPELRQAAGSAGRPPAASGVLRRAVAAVRRRLAADGTDRGANPVELAVVMPAILVLLFGSIQVAAWFVARSTALHAAQSGVNAQRVLEAPAGAGEARAARFLRTAGDWLVGWDETGPTCVTGATEVTCTVTGRSLSVVPGVSFPVRQTAHGTVERWTTG